MGTKSRTGAQKIVVIGVKGGPENIVGVFPDFIYVTRPAVTFEGAFKPVGDLFRIAGIRGIDNQAFLSHFDPPNHYSGGVGYAGILKHYTTKWLI
jgi:hypothetical protein